MKVCVFGAGALGGHLAAQLIAAKNCELSLVARGAHLAAIRESGLMLKVGGKEVGGKPAAATDNAATLPPQDIVFVGLKAQTLSTAAAAIGKLLKPDGCAVFLMNGIPWWWNHGLPGKSGTLPLLDADGALWREVRPERTIGSVLYSPNEVTAPGRVVHTGQNKWIFGEPDLSASARLKAIIDLVGGTGLETEASKDIRREIFRKLANNASNNTLCALTRLDSAGTAENEGLAKLSMSIISETLAVAATLGWDMRSEVNVEQTATRARGKPGQKPSTLQDVLAGKSLEIDGLLGQTQAFAREHGIATPVIDVCLPLLRGLDASLRAK